MVRKVGQKPSTVSTPGPNDSDDGPDLLELLDELDDRDFATLAVADHTGTSRRVSLSSDDARYR